ncbi:MAG TPA: glycosyltransferase [Solimonas sp.]
MGRILIATLPLAGHLYPALAIASKLSRRGHTVAWATPPAGLSSRLLADGQVFPLPLLAEQPPDLDRTQARGFESVRTFFEHYALPMARQTFEALREAVTVFQPDAWLVDHQMVGAAIAARASDRPWATLATSSASIHRVHPTMDAWVADALGQLQTELLPGRPPVERPDFSPHAVIVPSVEALIGERRARFEAAYHFVGPLRDEARADSPFPWSWLQPDRRKILVSLGTVNRDLGSRFFEMICDAMRLLPDVQAILVAPETVAGGAPDNVLVCQQVPQISLLARVDGVLCHAGHNTVCEALAQGVPLIVSPIRHDQPLIAEQVLLAGAGLFLRHGKATASATSALIRQLLEDPGPRSRAAELSVAMRSASGADGAADVIERLLTPGERP